MILFTLSTRMVLTAANSWWKPHSLHLPKFAVKKTHLGTLCTFILTCILHTLGFFWRILLWLIRHATELVVAIWSFVHQNIHSRSLYMKILVIHCVASFTEMLSFHNRMHSGSSLRLILILVVSMFKRKSTISDLIFYQVQLNAGCYLCGTRMSLFVLPYLWVLLFPSWCNFWSFRIRIAPITKAASAVKYFFARCCVATVLTSLYMKHSSKVTSGDCGEFVGNGPRTRH